MTLRRSGATIKYTSAIAKNFCSAIAIALTAALSPITAASLVFHLGLVFVFASMALFSWPEAKPSTRSRAS